MADYGADDKDRFVIGECDTLFVTASRPACSTANLPHFKYGCFLPMEHNSHNVKFTTQNHLLPKSGMHEASLQAFLSYAKSNISLKANLYAINHINSLESRNSSK
jgi:hypothetical protein